MHAMKFSVIAAAIVCAVPVLAEDHLEPERSVLGGDTWLQGYDDIVVGVLKDAYSREVVARMVVLPSSQPEYAVGVSKTGDRYAIFVVGATIPLSNYEALSNMENARDEKGNPVRDDKSIAELRKMLPTDWHDVKVNRCAVAIDAPLGERLVDVWGKMLMQTRYPEPEENETVRIDGVDFHFYSYGKAGQTWSPTGRKAGTFVDVGNAMAAYCDEKGKHELATLNAKVDDLLAQLKP
jgi:hypothetical protein